MSDEIQIAIKPLAERKVVPFEAILQRLSLGDSEKARLRSYTVHEQRQRAEYHGRRYLRHLTEAELHDRVGHLIANVFYISSRNRYSANSRNLPYWQERLAHVAEELALRGCDVAISSEILRHLPRLGARTPRAVKLDHNQGAALYRYDKLKYLKRLLTEGEIYLRCASTEDPTNDFARGDGNELCIHLRLLAADLEIHPDSRKLIADRGLDAVEISIRQPDFFMFCMSRAFDWRLFRDFNSDPPSLDPDDAIACLVITDVEQFHRRFRAAVAKLAHRNPELFPEGIQVGSGNAFYYDAFDPQECAPLLSRRDLLPVAKRREYNYQHEYRLFFEPFISKRRLPTGGIEALPKLHRTLIRLGSLADIAYIEEADSDAGIAKPHFLSERDPVLFASIVGVTLPTSGERVRFTYSRESKEAGRMDPENLTWSLRFGGRGSAQMHGMQIDIPIERNCPGSLRALRDFFGAFDVREHGNHLILFEAKDRNGSWHCKYRAHLAVGEPPDAELEVREVSFAIQYSAYRDGGEEKSGIEEVTLEAETYRGQWNGVGPIRLNVTYRALLLAEMIFIQRLIDAGFVGITAFEAKSREMGYAISRLSVSARSPGTAAEGEPSTAQR